MNNEDYSIVPETHNPRTYSYRVAMDNYEPTRNDIYVEHGIIIYSDPVSGDTAYVIEYPAMMTDDTAQHSNYIIDFGHSKHPVITYVAGWPKNEARVFTRDFPKSLNDASWFIGPRKTYHIRIQGYKE